MRWAPRSFAVLRMTSNTQDDMSRLGRIPQEVDQVIYDGQESHAHSFPQLQVSHLQMEQA